MAPEARPVRDRAIAKGRDGGAAIHRWARQASLAGASLAVVEPAFRGVRALGVPAMEPPGLGMLAALAMPFLVAGAGLALSATVEDRRARNAGVSPARGARRRGLPLTWALVILGVLIVLLSRS